MTIKEDDLENISVGYARCSTDQQDDSIPQQKELISIWAEQNNYPIVDWYIDDGYSGTDFVSRPDFYRLWQDVENNPKFRNVIVLDETRWGRAINPRENGYWKFHFEMHGVFVKIINTNSKNGNDAGDILNEVLEGVQASGTSKSTSEATKRGQKANAKNGYSNGGTPSYAYKRIALNKYTHEFVRELPSGTRSHEDEKVVFDLGDPFEVEIVKRIFQMKAEGLGYMRIANVLNSENIPCPKRGRWKNKNQRWSSSTICTIITNPTYTGARVFNRHPQSHYKGRSKPLWFNDPSEWIIKKNAHPAIISEELFNQINSKRKPYARTNRFFYKSPYLLSGLLKCKSCGFHFQGQSRKLISKRTKEEYTLSYYEDGGYQNKGNAVCHSYLLRKAELERVIINQIKNFISDDKFLSNVYSILEKKLLNTSEIDSLLSNYKKQLDANKRVLQNLLELIKEGVNLQEVKEEILRINRENEFLQKSYLEVKNKKINKKNINEVVDKVKELIDNFETTFSSAPLHVQKNIIKQFLEEIVVDPKKGEIHCYFRKVPWLDNKLSQKNIYGNEDVVKSLNWRIKASRRKA